MMPEFSYGVLTVDGRRADIALHFYASRDV
jgi:hypothetical protein